MHNQGIDLAATDRAEGLLGLLEPGAEVLDLATEIWGSTLTPMAFSVAVCQGLRRMSRRDQDWIGVREVADGRAGGEGARSGRQGDESLPWVGWTR